MSEPDALLAEIMETAAHYSGGAVTADTRLYSDLGMTGDDAAAFIAAFANKYAVEMSGFVWLRYFDDEGADMMGPAIVLGASVLSPAFAVRWQAARDAEREITMAHLAEVARARVWHDPDETFRRKPKLSPLTLAFSAAALLAMAFFFVTGVIVTHGLLTGAMGDTRVVTLIGVAAVGVLLPAFLAFASWRQIQRKLASARSA